ncbi:hypothetical protein COLO4_02939 [Corchorus olitorius]|uniref:LRR receptor-like serine/threonine-protein kinase n=1 Tax=Corchorus olitorius TaxID=93759 RepID=A0A1R3KZV9_9ROSI|nr:hypothetical protein COLO4_02939 [Corchorus olitorius]
MEMNTVRALNSIFEKWDTQAPSSNLLWNTTGDPCSGLALSQSDSDFEDGDNNPAIRCDCTFQNNTLCHITRLSIAHNTFSGPIPKELGNLKELYLLRIGGIYNGSSSSLDFGFEFQQLNRTSSKFFVQYD